MNITKRLYIHLLLLGLFLIPVNHIYAQACCSGGVPLGGSFGLGTADNKSWQVLFTYDFNAINSLVDVSQNLNDDTRSRTTQTSLLEINYGFNDRLTFTTLIPYIRQERNIKSYGGTNDISIAQGFGDILFMLKYRILKPTINQNWEFVVGGGIKLPSGKTTHKSNQGFVLAADMQPGSGSLDGIYWMYLNKSHFLNPKLSLVSVSTYRLNGKNKNYNVNQEYKFGNELQINLGLNYNVFLKWPVDIFTFLRYRTQKADLIDGNQFPGSGGKWMYLIPGLNFNFSPKVSLRLSGDIPIYRKLEGTQLTTTYKLTAALLVKFSAQNHKQSFKKTKK